VGFIIPIKTQTIFAFVLGFATGKGFTKKPWHGERSRIGVELKPWL